MARVHISGLGRRLGMGSLGQEIPVYDAGGNIIDYTQGDDGGGDVAAPPSSPIYPVLNNPSSSPINATQSIPTTAASAALPTAISSLFQTASAPSPRVATAPVSSPVVLAGLSNIWVIGGVLVVGVLLLGGKKRR